MTTAEEHRRNLGWSTSMLEDLVGAARPGSSLHKDALRLLAAAYSIEDLARLDTASAEQVEAAIRWIKDTHAILLAASTDMRGPGIGTRLLATLRHYPGPPQFRHWRVHAAHGSPMGGIILRTAGMLAG